MTELLLQRLHNLPTYTIGRLFVNGEYFCDTLEDKNRGLHNGMTEEEIKTIKVYGQTAIPYGLYNINMNTVSPKFKSRSWAKPYKGIVPRLEDVKGFEGVLIHPGNSDKDTYGCILVGENKAKGKVLNSQKFYHDLMKILVSSQKITLNII